MASRTFLARVYITLTKTEISVDGNNQLIIPAGSTERAEWLKNRQKDETTAANTLRGVTGVVVKSIEEVDAVMTR